jgi:hypothetical protein
MTKKDYEKIASAIRDSFRDAELGYVYRKDVIASFMRMLAEDNDNFNPYKFHEACWGKPPEVLAYTKCKISVQAWDGGKTINTTFEVPYIRGEGYVTADAVKRTVEALNPGMSVAVAGYHWADVEALT